MRAVQISDLDGPAAVSLADVPVPDSGADSVLVEVHSAGVTFPDVLQTRGKYQIKPQLPFVPGTEVAGVVRSSPVGAHVGPGDRVAACCGLGGFAGFVTVASTADARTGALRPEGAEVPATWPSSPPVSRGRSGMLAPPPPSLPTWCDAPDRPLRSKERWA